MLQEGEESKEICHTSDGFIERTGKSEICNYFIFVCMCM